MSNCSIFLIITHPCASPFFEFGISIQDIQETMDKYEDPDDNVIKMNGSHSLVSLELFKER